MCERVRASERKMLMYLEDSSQSSRSEDASVNLFLLFHIMKITYSSYLRQLILTISCYEIVDKTFRGLMRDGVDQRCLLLHRPVSCPPLAFESDRSSRWHSERSSSRAFERENPTPTLLLPSLPQNCFSLPCPRTVFRVRVLY